MKKMMIIDHQKEVIRTAKRGEAAKRGDEVGRRVEYYHVEAEKLIFANARNFMK